MLMCQWFDPTLTNGIKNYVVVGMVGSIDFFSFGRRSRTNHISTLTASPFVLIPINIAFTSFCDRHQYSYGLKGRILQSAESLRHLKAELLLIDSSYRKVADKSCQQPIHPF